MAEELKAHSIFDKNGLWQHELRKITDLVPNPKNPRTITEKTLNGLRQSLKDNGYTHRIIVDKHNKILSGHARWLVMKADDPNAVIEVLVAQRELTAQEEKDAILGHNVLGGIWDIEAAQMNFEPLDWQKYDLVFDLDDLGEVGSGDKKENTGVKGSLAEDFLVVPASVLNTRDGAWQDRKRIWVEKIGDNGESREGKLDIANKFNEERFGNAGSNFNSVSILDPVLAEIMCKWFLPTTGQCNVCDPFAGDTVFGFVAGTLGHKFTGIELRPDQAKLNNERGNPVNATYICDDGQNIAQHIPAESQDMVFSCPPYFDLEKYSDDPKDASNQKEYADFLKILTNALTGAVQCLKNNRFAVVVMSNVRDHKGGAYYDICGDIVRCMQNNGLMLYNEFILVNALGTGAVRGRNNMRTRKNIRTHQEVLVFYKGKNPTKEIPTEFAEIKCAEADTDESENV